jgi:L-alanine-DL-glutamate epimerase-like enolase superfamily enzyme
VSLDTEFERVSLDLADPFTIARGTQERDRDIVAAVRETASDVRLRVDANEAWTPHEALDRIEMLTDFGVEFVEQPVPAENLTGLEYVHERSSLPIAADESCVTLADIPDIADYADIANIKLMRCGGLREVRQISHRTCART